MDKEIEAKVSEIQEANKKLVSDFQVENDRKLKGLMTEVAFAEHKAAFERRFAEVNDELAKLKVPQIKGIDADGNQSKEMKSFHDWCQKSKEIGLQAIRGASGVVPDQKVLTIADSTHAGVLAPYEYVNEIIKGVTLYSPMRQLATVRQTSAYAAEFPTRTAIGSATWVAESAEKTETTGLLYALTEIKTFEMKVLYKATQKMLEDSAFNLEQEIAEASGEAFGTLEGTAYYSGATTAPEGITANATVLADAKSVATDNTLAFDDLIATQYALASPYAKNAAWLMNRSLMGVLVGIKNATTNGYVLQPDAQQGFPLRMLGSPVYEWSDFPAISSTTLSSTPGDGGIVLAYGDFKRGYKIVDRVDVTIQRLVEKYAEYGMIGFLVRKRVGGGVVLPEAIQLLKNITT